MSSWLKRRVIAGMPVNISQIRHKCEHPNASKPARIVRYPYRRQCRRLVTLASSGYFEISVTQCLGVNSRFSIDSLIDTTQRSGRDRYLRLGEKEAHTAPTLN